MAEEAQPAVEVSSGPSTCLLALEDIGAIACASTASWRAVGAIAAKAGRVDGTIDGAPCHFVYTEWDDRQFRVDLIAAGHPPLGLKVGRRSPVRRAV